MSQRISSMALLTCSILLASCAPSPSAIDSSDPQSTPSPTESACFQFCAEPSITVPESPPATTIPESPPATPPSPIAPLVEDEWKDDEGYAYGASLLSSQIDVDVDVAGARPGKANLTVTVTSQGTVSNLTEQRQAAMPKVGYFPVWKKKSDFCKLATESADDVTNGYPRVSNAFEGEERAQEAYCRLLVGATLTSSYVTAETPGEPELDVGEVRDVVGMLSTTSSIQADPIEVDEADVPRAVAAIKAPYAHVLGRASSDESPVMLDCLMFSDSPALPGIFLSASSAAIKECDPENG